MKVLFLVILEEKIPPTNFSLKNLPATKMDVVARIILSIFPRYTKHVKPILHVVFAKDSPTLLEVTSLTESGIKHDEISIAAEIRDLLVQFNSHHKQTPKDNFQVEWKSMKNFEKYLRNRTIEFGESYYLHESGKSIDKEILPDSLHVSYVFILGGRYDISDAHEKIIEKLNIPKINLGDKSYLASTCITKILYHLEKSSF